MSTVPDATPVAIPVPAPIVAIVVLSLVHTPPGVPFESVPGWPTQMAATPVMAVGAAVTVIVIDTEHPPAPEQTIVLVPGAIPATTPEVGPTVAIAVAVELHVTPDVMSDNVEVCPTHRVVTPLIAPGIGLTVMTFVAEHPAGSV